MTTKDIILCNSRADLEPLIQYICKIKLGRELTDDELDKLHEDLENKAQNYEFGE